LTLEEAVYKYAVKVLDQEVNPKKKERGLTTMKTNIEEEQMITMRDAATYSFEVAYAVACALLLGNHDDCPGCMICDVINAAKVDIQNKDNKGELS
jgi:predicted homoserine dehydrogenase-like protein